MHQHNIKKTHISFIEFDDVIFTKLGNATYFGEGNSLGRTLEYDFEYCLQCDLRLLNGEPVLTRDILVELEKFVLQAKSGSYKEADQITVQHSDFDVLERLIKSALSLGKLKTEQLIKK